MFSQLTFDGFEDIVDVALERVRGYALPHSNHTAFVREVAAKALCSRSGSLILCAAPADVSCDELIREISDELTSTSESITGEPFSGLSVVSLPASQRRNRTASSLLDAYRDVAANLAIGHRRPPEFQLEFGPSAIGVRSTFHEISGMLRMRSTSVYVLKNAHWLQPAGAPIDDAIESIATLAEFAEHTKRTHILIGNTLTVLEWLRCAEIARATHPCCLAPYDLSEEVDKASFLAVLAAYDGVLPWAGKEALVAKVTEVDKIVHGSPHRLRKWLLQSLCMLKAEREVALTWQRFLSSQLLPTEEQEAKRELDLVRRVLGAHKLAKPETGQSREREQPEHKASRKTAPGTRKPNRNGVAA